MKNCPTMQALTGFEAFRLTAVQTGIAFDCLRKAIEKHGLGTADFEAQLLPYLLHATPLFFLNRDQAAFSMIYRSPAYEKLGLAGKLRQLPTFSQLTAVVGSRKFDPSWTMLDETERAMLESLPRWSDEALGCVNFKAFRDQLMINGVPPGVQDETCGAPFTLVGFDYPSLCEEALSAWETLQALRREQGY